MSAEDLPLDPDVEQLREENQELRRQLKMQQIRHARHLMRELTDGLDLMKKSNPDLFMIFIRANKSRIRKLLTYLEGDQP